MPGSTQNTRPSPPMNWFGLPVDVHLHPVGVIAEHRSRRAGHLGRQHLQRRDVDDRLHAPGVRRLGGLVQDLRLLLELGVGQVERQHRVELDHADPLGGQRVQRRRQLRRIQAGVAAADARVAHPGRPGVRRRVGLDRRRRVRLGGGVRLRLGGVGGRRCLRPARARRHRTGSASAPASVAAVRRACPRGRPAAIGPDVDAAVSGRAGVAAATGDQRAAGQRPAALQHQPP